MTDRRERVTRAIHRTELETFPRDGDRDVLGLYDPWDHTRTIDQNLNDDEVLRITKERVADPMVVEFTVTKNRHDRRAEAAEARRAARKAKKGRKQS